MMLNITMKILTMNSTSKRSGLSPHMTLLLVVGPPLEEKYGSRRLLGCILFTALASGMVQFIFFPGTPPAGQCRASPSRYPSSM